MKHPSLVRLLAVFALLVGFAVAARAATASRPPNIIFILADDLGYGDLSCYGQRQFKMPNLDRLAARGMRFTQHYSGSSVCAPSRCVFLTGVHTGHASIRGNLEVQPEGQTPMPGNSVTLAKLLRERGYATAAFGKWGLGFPGSEGEPLNEGFDHFFGYNCQRLDHSYYPDHLWDDRKRVDLPQNGEGKKGVYAPELIQQHVLDYITEHRDQPFFLYLTPPLPHAEMEAPERLMIHHRGKYGPETPFAGVDGGPEFRKGPYASQPEPKAAYAAMIEMLDDHVGQVIDRIDGLQLTNDTIFVFTSDNGAAGEGGINPSDFNSSGGLRGMKRDLYEGGIRAPMIASWAGHIAPGTTSDLVSAFWDWLPTFAQIAGAQTPAGLDGFSLLPTLTGRGTQQQHEYLYWEFHEKGGRVAARQGNWKGVRYDVAKNPNSPLELYDLSTDLHEKHNVASAHPDVVARLDAIINSARTPSKLFNFRSGTYLGGNKGVRD